MGGELTARQKEVLDYINFSIAERGYPPTLREIGKHLRIRSTNGVNDHLKALERKGFLQRDDLKSRSLRPKDGHEIVRVPVLGRVAAGQPLLAVEQVDDTIGVDRSLVGNGSNIFSLRVRGDSMIEDGIHDGDYVFVRKQQSATAGETVVALVEEEANRKTLLSRERSGSTAASQFDDGPNLCRCLRWRRRGSDPRRCCRRLSPTLGSQQITYGSVLEVQVSCDGFTGDATVSNIEPITKVRIVAERLSIPFVSKCEHGG